MPSIDLARATTSLNGAAAATVDAVKVYGSGSTEVRALDGVTVAFDTARFRAIMGPSGSGKSTLLHCIAGLDSLTSGVAYIGDTDLGALDDNDLTELRRDSVGFIFQAFKGSDRCCAWRSRASRLASSVSSRPPSRSPWAWRSWRGRSS